MKTVEQIADEAVRAVDRVINNNIKTETCPEKKNKPEWKKDEVRAAIARKLLPGSSTGPTQTK